MDITPQNPICVAFPQTLTTPAYVLVVKINIWTIMNETLIERKIIHGLFLWIISTLNLIETLYAKNLLGSSPRLNFSF